MTKQLAAKPARRVAPILAALLAVVGCDADRSPVAPVAPVPVPNFSVAAGGPGSGNAWSTLRSSREFRSSGASAVIGVEGGTLKLGEHLMTVAPGTVSRPTFFAMLARSGDRVIVDVYAFRSDGSLMTDFSHQPVTLVLSYRDGNVAAGSAVAIAYLPTGNDDGAIEPLFSQSDPVLMLVRASLTHFSTYAVIVD